MDGKHWSGSRTERGGRGEAPPKWATDMTTRKWILIGTLFVLGAGGALLCAAAAGLPAERPHAPMEFLGVGPEMFSDRGVAWVKSLSSVIKELITELGVLGLALIAVIQNLRAKAEIKDRLDRQGERIDRVALATAPGATTTPEGDVTIKQASVQIQTEPRAAAEPER